VIAEGVVSTRGLGRYLATSPVIQLIGITTAAVIQLVADTREYLIGEYAESSSYCTVRVRFWVWVVVPDLAVTTMV